MATERITDQHPSQPFNDNKVRHMPEPVRSVKNIAFEAQTRKYWIYDPKTKDWLSPNEFLEKNNICGLPAIKTF